MLLFTRHPASDFNKGVKSDKVSDCRDIAACRDKATHRAEAKPRDGAEAEPQ